MTVKHCGLFFFFPTDLRRCIEGNSGTMCIVPACVCYTAYAFMVDSS